MSTVTESHLKAKSMTPGFTVNDLARSIAFYEALGFVVSDRWEHEGALLGVMARAGGALLGLSQDDWKKGRDREKGVGMRVWIGTTQDIDQLAERAKSAGITLDAEPHDAEWGSRQFLVTDPDGFHLTIAAETER